MKHIMIRLYTIAILCILNITAAAFITDQCYSTSHQHHQHASSANARLKITPLHSSASDVSLHEHAEEKRLKPSSTTQAKFTPTTQLLSSDEHNRIDQLVQERSEARWSGDYIKADEIRASIDETRVVIPMSRIVQTIEGFRYFPSQQQQDQQDVDLEYKVMVTDIPRSEGGGSNWELIPLNNPLVEEHMAKQEDNVLQLAHAALGMAVSASERGVEIDNEILKELITRAEDRLNTLKERKAMSIFFPGAAAAAGELHGRKAADAVLWFALAGVGGGSRREHYHMNLYNDLVDIATEELQRFGRNSSCRAKDVLHIVERVAMAGIIGESSKRLYCVAADCLEVKMMGSSDSPQEAFGGMVDDTDEDEGGIDYRNIIQSLRGSSFGLHSDRSLLGLWRFSTRQKKQRAFFTNAARHFDGKFRDDTTAQKPSSSLDVNSEKSTKYDWSAMFKDPSRPLVVDVGCGMGVSLLGLANFPNTDDQLNEIQIDWKKCNFIGVDLSRLAIGYAHGVCSRWSSKDLNFVVDSAEECLSRISETYPGEVPLVMLQFPTPYRFQSIAADDEDGASDYHIDKASSVAPGYNSQLPEGAASDDFMVTEKLLSQVYDVLSKHSGQLLLQSNCEDVAVHMRNVATKKVGFQSVELSHSVTSLDAATQRAQRYVTMGGERAIGKYWSAEKLLPLGGRTETEVACLLDGKPVHRCLLRAS